MARIIRLKFNENGEGTIVFYEQVYNCLGKMAGFIQMT